MTTERSRSSRHTAGHALLHASRLAFALAFLLAMSTPAWRTGPFTVLPLVRFRVSGQTFQIGALALLPLIAGCTWVVGRSLEHPRRRCRWGPAYLALPVLAFGALALARIWPIHIQHTAVVTAVAIALFWCAYLYGVSDWPTGWAVGMMAVLLATQGMIGALQFAKQGSIGLSWMGEVQLDPQRGEGMSVIAVAGRRWLRAYGLMPHPNALGGYLSMSLLVCIGALGSTSARSRRWLGLCIALGSVGLLFTFSRSAWLGTLLGLVYMAGVTRPWRRVNWRSRRTSRIVTAIGALLFVGAIVITIAYGDLLATRFFRLSDPLERRSLDDRIHDIREAWSLIRTVPFKGTGSGYYVGALWAGVGEDRPPGFRKVHNVPLLAAAELGIPGAVFWLWMLLGPPIAFARRTWPRSPQPSPQSHRTSRDVAHESTASAGWAGAFVSALTLSMLDSYLYVPSVWWAALYLGVLAGHWAKGEVSMRAHREIA